MATSQIDSEYWRKTPLNVSSSLLIQISSLRRSNSVLTSMENAPLNLIYLATHATEFSPSSAPLLRQKYDERLTRVLPTWHESLSLLLYCTRKTSHRGRTSAPSCIKWWSYVFRKWVGPLSNKWSNMDASTLCSLKSLSSSVWKTERWSYSGRLGQSIIYFARKKIPFSPDSPFLYITWHLYCRLQYNSFKFFFHYRIRHKITTIPWHISDGRELCKFTSYTGAYTNCRLGTSILIILMNHRKSLGSIWTFNASSPQRRKDCCVTLPRDNHTCEVCHTLLRWPHLFFIQRKELYQKRNLAGTINWISHGVSILTDPMVKCCEVFDYFGI